MKQQNGAYQEFRKGLHEALDTLLVKELNRLKEANVERLTSFDRDGAAELLATAGFVRYLGEYRDMLNEAHYYEATEKGKQIYERLRGVGHD